MCAKSSLKNVDNFHMDFVTLKEIANFSDWNGNFLFYYKFIRIIEFLSHDLLVSFLIQSYDDWEHVGTSYRIDHAGLQYFLEIIFPFSLFSTKGFQYGYIFGDWIHIISMSPWQGLLCK
jgi:hypothetical protein